MTALRDLISANPSLVLMIGGLVIGALFGWLVFKTNFCTMGSISDLLFLDDSRRLRAWLLSIAVAILATQGLAAAGVVALDKSMYLSANLNWLGHLLGGAMLGFGMAFTGGCPSRSLARLGGGDLRSGIVLIVTGITAFAAIGGVIGPARAALERTTALPLSGFKLPSQGLGDILAKLTGLSTGAATLAATVLVAGGLIAACFAHTGFRSSLHHIWSGVGVGLLVAAGWAVTGLAYDDLAAAPVAPVSLTFVRPSGDALEWLQRATALGWPGFGVSTVFGAIAGAGLAAVLSGQFRLSSYTSGPETARSLMGAMLMGAGGVMALGCTVGQGITGASTLALGAFLTLAAIIGGCIAGLKALERWS